MTVLPKHRSNVHTLADLPPVSRQDTYAPEVEQNLVTMRLLETIMQGVVQSNERLSSLVQKMNVQTSKLEEGVEALIQRTRQIEETSSQQAEQLAAIQQTQSLSRNYLFGALCIAGFACCVLGIKYH